MRGRRAFCNAMHSRGWEQRGRISQTAVVSAREATGKRSTKGEKEEDRIDGRVADGEASEKCK